MNNRKLRTVLKFMGLLIAGCYVFTHLIFYSAKSSTITLKINSEVSLNRCSYSIKDVKDPLNKVIHKLYSFEEIENELKSKSIHILNGGVSLTIKNHNCESDVNLAIIVPYRDRMSHLKLFLSNMHPFLTRQKINYGLYFIEPIANISFNRGIIKNIGFVEAIKDQLNNPSLEVNGKAIEWNCFIFHDVDFYPENNKNLYKCDKLFPFHMASAVEQFGYESFYNTSPYNYWGGVFAVTKQQFITLNGLSNLFFGWGGPDDDFYDRVGLKYGHFEKQDVKIGRYLSPKSDHYRDINNYTGPVRRYLRNKMKKEGFMDEGLTTLQYKVLKVERKNLFTRIVVDYNKDDILKYSGVYKLYYSKSAK